MSDGTMTIGAFSRASFLSVKMLRAYHEAGILEPDLPSQRGGVEPGEVPAARIAVATHAGGYDTIGDTYRWLGGWVAMNASSADERVRENYLVSYAEAADPARVIELIVRVVVPCWRA